MEFKEILQRYHISPLRFDDGVELSERDYFDLAVILQKYYLAKKMTGSTRIPKIPDNLVEKTQKNFKRSLLPMEVENIMDMLMEQTGGNVL